MNLRKLVPVLCLLAISSCSFAPKKNNREVADDRRDGRRDEYRDPRDGSQREEDRGDRRHGREGFEFGEYTSQEIRDNTGFIDVSMEFSRFRGLEGKNFKGLLIEAQSIDMRGTNVPFPRDPREMRDPRNPRDIRDPRIQRPEERDIYLTLDQRPVDRFQVQDSYGRQFFYADFNREVGDKFGLLNIRYNPRNTIIKQLTVLTNDNRPWERPLPPVMTEYGVMYKNNANGKIYFGKGFNQMDADFKAKELCQTAGNAFSCVAFKTETLVRSETEFFCSVKNSASGFSFGGTAQSRLEAEYNALMSCHEKGNIFNCTVDLTCTDGRMSAPNTVTACMFRNNASGKTFFSRGNSELQAKFLSNQLCQASGNQYNCVLSRCETAEESWKNYTCTVTNAATNRTFRGDSKLKIEAEAFAKQNCEMSGNAYSCTKNLSCMN